MLSDRRQQILCALIEEYVAHACPVGSRTIAENHHLGVSSATIRNELSALEEAGYITQPHTSAGRIPTDAGYREFVDGILADADRMGARMEAEQIRHIRESAEALDDLIERTNAELARLTQCLSVIMAPRSTIVRIRQISLVSLADTSALVVCVTEDGQVANGNAVFLHAVSPDELKCIEDALNQALVGQDVQSISTFAFADPCLKTDEAKMVIRALEMAAETFRHAHTSRSGMSTLLRKPEFHEAEAILPVMEILEDDTVLLHALSRDGAQEGDIRIRIGRENAAEQLLGVSVIAGTYGRGGAQGIVAVIGPTRMDYTRTISAVRAAQDILKDE